MNLTDEEIRIKVAEACGWTVNPVVRNLGTHPQVQRGHHILPNYPEDLNACAEFEKTLTDAEHRRFRMHLWDIVIALGTEDSWDQNIVSANAKTRCLAYLKTKGIIL